MKLKLKRIEPLQAGYVSGLLYVLISLIIVVPIMFISLMTTTPNVVSYLMLIGIPLLYGFLGFIGGIISAALYNFVAKRVGGLEVEFEEIKEFTEK